MFPSAEGEERDAWRWLRRALFPLALIVLLVWLAAQTLVPQREDRDERIYSEAKALVRDTPDRVDLVVFDPEDHELEIRLGTGERLVSHYPSEASALELEQLLDAEGIRHDSRGRGETAWWSLLTYLLPFVLFFAFWIFLMRSFRRGGIVPPGSTGRPT